MRRWNKTFWALTLSVALGATSGSVFAAPPTPAQAAINETLSNIDAGRFEQALESVKKALQAEPNRVEAHLLYIRLMTDLKRRPQVQAEYAKRRDQKKDGLSLVLYGRTLEKPDQMEATFRKALTLDPRLGWAHYCLATVHMERGQVDKAIASLEEAIRVQPNFTQAMDSLALLYVAQGKIDPAIATYQKTVSLNPENAQSLFQLGSLYGRKGDTAKAAEYLEKSRKLAPQNPQVLANLAFIYFKQKRYDESIALYDQVLKAAPSFTEAKLNREVVKRVKKGEIKFEAVALMEKAMEATTPEDAIARYRRVVEASPNFELPYLALGQLLAATKKPADAEKAFQRAVELNPGFVEGVRMIAEFYIVSGQPLKAEPYLNKAITMAPNDAELYAALGAVYASAGQPAKAEQAFGKAASMLPGALALPSRLSKARAIAAQGRYTAAATELQAILKAAPRFTDAQLELGNVYFVMEEFDKAKVQYQAVLKVAPTSKELKALIAQVDEKKAEHAKKAKDHMRARQIVVKTQAEADGLLKQLQAGASFEALAKQKSIAPEASIGGDIGYFKKGELMPDIERAVVALKPGQTSGVVKTSNGFHIIKRLN